MPLYSLIDKFNENLDLFHDSDRSSSDNEGPFLIIIDDFYEKPHEVRKLALEKRYYQYAPPELAQVGDERYNDFYRRIPSASDSVRMWLATALKVYRGHPVHYPEKGYCYSDKKVKNLMNLILPNGEKINEKTWNALGDGWNGAFHLMFKELTMPIGAIHHHYKEQDLPSRGWSGVVYLTPNNQSFPEAGTSIFKHIETGLCIAKKGIEFSSQLEDYELAYFVENKFNRLVLFRENILHRVSSGFGQRVDSSRLTQTFFFLTNKNPK
jgi:hypothetical protein